MTSDNAAVHCSKPMINSRRHRLRGPASVQDCKTNFVLTRAKAMNLLPV